MKIPSPTEIFACATLATAVPATAGCNNLATLLAGPSPELEEMGAVPREPMQLGVVVDVSKSDIKKELPQVISVTREVLSGSDLLQGGDTVILCKMGGSADCQTFTLNQDRAALLTDLDSVTSEAMTTWIRPALAKILQDLDTTKPCELVVWSDFKEEANSPASVNAGACPVKLLVPTETYTVNAKEMCTHVAGAGGCEVKKVTDGAAFKNALKGYMEDLQQAAQAAADAKAQAEWAAKNLKHQEELQAYKKKFDTYKKIAEGIIASITALLLAGVYGAYRFITRPKLQGFLVVVEDGRARAINLGGDQTERKVPRVGVLKAKRGGFMLEAGEEGGSERIKFNNGINIGGNCFWYEKRPLAEEMERLEALISN